jgi:hypothetical protein
MSDDDDQDELLKEKLDQMNPQRVQRDNFLNTISQIESSGGQNINHPVSNAPIQAGQQAVGQYGLMPNTVQEMARRTRGPASIAPGSPEEQQVAEQLATRVLNRFQDPNMAAYAWHSGHNLTPDQVKERDYMNDPYVQKFQKIRQKLGK